MVYVIRFDDPEPNPMWLRSEHPVVKWRPLADARRYRTKAAAVSALTKLRFKKRLIVRHVEQMGVDLLRLVVAHRSGSVTGLGAAPQAFRRGDRRASRCRALFVARRHRPCRRLPCVDAGLRRGISVDWPCARG